MNTCRQRKKVAEKTCAGENNEASIQERWAGGFEKVYTEQGLKKTAK